MAEEHTSACSEETNSLCDEERVRKLFQACDADGDGYIDSEDLLTVCRELNLEDSLEELMKELGADENGRISYKEFLQRRLALRPEIDALRNTPRHQQTTITPDYLPTSSDNSLGGASGGKCGGESSWEFDSGARDLSPEPNTLQRLVEAAGCSLTATNTASLLQLANKLHLAALASLRGEILELTTRLHAVTEERDASERGAVDAAQQYEERITELHCVIAELGRKVDRQRSLVITEEDDVPSETEQSVETCSQAEADDTLQVKEPALAFDDAYIKAEAEEVVMLKKERKSVVNEELSELRTENCELREQLRRAEVELRQTTAVLEGVREDRDRLRNKLRESPRVVSSPPQPTACRDEPPVLKVAERVRLRRIDRHVTGLDLSSLGVSRTEVAEQLVSGVRGQCDRQEAGLEVECERQTARLEHARTQITTLQLALDDTKAQSERLSLLVGKYESNVTASRLALNSCDRALDAYDLLVSLLDARCDQQQTADNDRCPEEGQLRRLIADLRAERALVGGTVVELESLSQEQPAPYSTPHHRPNAELARKLDLETAVLMQELMGMREDKAELRARVHLLERERESHELRVATLNCQQQAHLATVQHLQARLDQLDTDAKPEEGEECGEGRESRLRDRLKEVTSTLERVSRNAELRQRQAVELANELKTSNSGLVQSLERCKRKSQSRLRKLDTQMLAMVERHAAQVRTLKQRISVLEEAREQQNHQSQSSSVASETSL